MSPIGSYVDGLTSKGQVGVLLWEHRGWILRIASLIKVEKQHSPSFLLIHIDDSTFHHSLKRTDSRQRIVSNACKSLISYIWQAGATTNLLTKIKCFLSLGEIIVHPNLGALNKPSLTMVKKNYSSSTFAFIGILPLPWHSRFVKIYLTLQSLPAFYFSLQLLS